MRLPIGVLGLAALLSLGSAATCPADVTFSFSFDGIPDGAVSSPLVGSGTVTLSSDPGPGTYALTSFASFSMSFAFNDGNTYTDADISTPLSEVLVVLYDAGGREGLFFSNTKDFGSGPAGGSIDFGLVDGLTFEPPGFGGSPLTLFEEGDASTGFFGDYVAVNAVPEPSSLIGLALGGGLLGLAARARTRRSLGAIAG